jgi:hypothetical protein
MPGKKVSVTEPETDNEGETLVMIGKGEVEEVVVP